MKTLNVDLDAVLLRFERLQALIDTLGAVDAKRVGEITLEVLARIMADELQAAEKELRSREPLAAEETVRHLRPGSHHPARDQTPSSRRIEALRREQQNLVTQIVDLVSGAAHRGNRPSGPRQSAPSGHSHCGAGDHATKTLKDVDVDAVLLRFERLQALIDTLGAVDAKGVGEITLEVLARIMADELQAAEKELVPTAKLASDDALKNLHF